MNKPITMIIDETKREIADICNNSMLPLYILEPIIKDLYVEIQELNKRQMQQERIAYEQSLIKQNNDNDNGASE